MHSERVSPLSKKERKIICEEMGRTATEDNYQRENTDMSSSDVSDLDSTESPKVLQQLTSKSWELQKRELGGILVYDAYAWITGCPKIQDYFELNPPRKPEPNLLFTEDEH